MKRTSLLARVNAHGCVLEREGGSHSIWIIPPNGEIPAVRYPCLPVWSRGLQDAAMSELAKPLLPNVLAARYASPQMCAVWSPEGRVVAERRLWLAVLRAQQELGLNVPDDALAAYEAALSEVDLEDIARREAVTRHDVKARIESFNACAGQEHIHKGMTSRDLTENVEQLQVFEALRLIRLKAVAALCRLAERAQQWRAIPLTGRTHNVAAQFTTVGKRLAMAGEELLRGLERLDATIETYPARGLKGAVGTQLDQMNLFAGDGAKVAALEARVAAHLGLPRTLENVGQVYPRSLDFEVVAALYQLGSGPSSFATTLRLMAGHELAGEGFLPGQVGSSAMPHKMNSRSCERLNGFHVILRGHLAMVEGLAGAQWNEGDVSCSVVRRVALPDAFFAADGLLETFLSILAQMGLNEAVIARENAYYKPFLLTTSVLMAAVQAGAGRETAHEAIKEHAVATLRDLQSGTIAENDLFQRLANDPRLPLTEAQVLGIASQDGATGKATAQVDAFHATAQSWLQRFPEAAQVVPAPML